jgi:protein TonB
VSYVSITIDRNGNVLKVNLATSSGSDVLDREAVEMVQRATPLPSPPASVASGQDRISIVVPVAFALQTNRP